MSSNFLSNERLIDKLFLNDTTAFEEIYHRHWFSLFSYCNGKLKSAQQAKIVVREIFVDLWENRQSLPENFSLSLYLYLEVRKSVVKALNEKINEEEFASNPEIIKSFETKNLLQARTPVGKMTFDEIFKAPLSLRHQPSLKLPPWRKHYPQNIFDLRNFKYAFQRVMHLF